jgi:hypothetical protein
MHALLLDILRIIGNVQVAGFVFVDPGGVIPDGPQPRHDLDFRLRARQNVTLVRRRGGMSIRLPSSSSFTVMICKRG